MAARATTEDRFFAALLAADGPALEALLTTDFLIIDVMTGSEAPGSRYTHVYVRAGQGWRLASAQGTPVAPAEQA